MVKGLDLLFQVSLHRENFATVGVFNCAVSYQYTFECPFLSFSFLTCPCTGQVNLDLTVIIVGEQDCILINVIIIL